MIIEYFERKLRLTNLEVWDIQCEEEIYRMFILDENRLPKSTDLNLPTNTVEEDLRKNLITVSIYSNDPVKDEHIECLDQFAKKLTDHVALGHCHVVVNFYTGVIDEIFERFLKEKFNLEYEKIPLMQLWHLNQN
ncbi:hypothetical protein MKZ26_16465 [Sporosarcina sp. FSL K6-6792]|uniref:hypothetical protein n=1 Tax=Sporosarcina sp. FSL K6-6792 TaxID=2921559 RepID=UPI0030FA6638